ncbi:efflux transporter outer membrane subunit [Mangrovibacterium marinum]|uniref:efflux transporter outer membrane subunit n=1 Tax=Mangrovibacterium marinum TaxID=1639118 RepID=UPI002A188DDB|nr:efflux transporter outer membrane subunit [Mangrovibacterium marinum]
MKTNSLKNMAFALLASATLLSCSSSRHYERSSINTEGLYGTTQTDSTNLANEAWESLFNDPVLKSLIAEGLSNNLSLQAAIERVKASEAYFKQSRQSMLPGISAQAGHTYVRNSESTYPSGPREYNAAQIALQASWEIDFWGKLNSAKKAAYADYLGTDAARKAVQTSLIANIATAYYNLLALDQQLVITQETVKTNAELVETMKVLKDHGSVTGAAVVQSEAARYAAEVTIPDLEQQIEATENSLCILLGRTPGTITRGKLEDQQVQSQLTVGVPSQLLDNRPDVMQAEYAVISAYETTNSAKAYFFPSVTLTASSGLEALEYSDLFDAGSLMANVVGGLTSPLFNKRANRTRLEVAKAQQAVALADFKNTLLTAGQEVSDALGTYQAAERKIDLRKKQLNALEKSVDYTKELLTYGSATYTEVLNAQQSYLGAQLNNVSDHLQQLTAVVTLYRALGGGWQ